VSLQARGGGTGGRVFRSEQVSSVSSAASELPGAKMAKGVPAGISTEAADGVWQERGGQGQAVAQQSSEVWQHAEAHSSAAGAGSAAAEASGAAARPKSSRIIAAYLMGLI